MVSMCASSHARPEPAPATVEILLATYNGAAFLEEQLDSLLAQSYRDWRLLIRDDGSTDATPRIVEAFRQRHPDRVKLLRDADRRLGHVGNFSRLLERSRASHVALCDQDDVWEPDKLSLSLARMRALELRHGSKTPLLVFTDLVVVDARLSTLFESFWALSGSRPLRGIRLGRLLQQNVVTGCTAVLNRALVDRAVPIPATAVHHDWWLGLVALTSGQVEPLEHRTVRYRQHGHNAVGSRRRPRARIPLRAALRYLANLSAKKERLMQRFEQAAALLERYRDDLTPRDRTVLAAYLRSAEVSALRRAGIALRHGLMPRGWTSQLAYTLHGSSRRWRSRP